MQKQKKCLPLQSRYQKTGLLFKKTMRFRMENAENLCKASAENLFYAEPQPNLAQNRRFCGNSSVGRAQPCQGWGREFESRFPLREEIAFGWSLFFVKRTFTRTRTRDAPRGSCRRSRLRGLRERQTQASLRSSLVFRSKKRLPSGGLFFC